MKELVSINTYLVESSEIGEWEGQEPLAAENLNRIYHALYDNADDDIETERLELMLETVWPHWQQNPELLELDDDLIEAFVEAVFLHFDPLLGQETIDEQY